MMPGQDQFVKKVAGALRHRCSVRPGDRLLVATSGGADSVALLRALAELAPRRRWELELCVGHVQHHLRDDQGGEGDAMFTEQLAGQLGLPFVRRDLDLSDDAGGRNNGNLEARARRGRYDALSDMAAQIDAGFVVTAHHGDDQLETLLMRLLRGAAVRGLAGMGWRRWLDVDGDVRLIRPMLGVDRAAVLRFLSDLQQPWREDHTNADASRLRARLRRDVLPVLHDVQPRAVKRAGEFADHMRDLRWVLEATVDDVRRDSVALLDDGTMVVARDEARDWLDAVLTELMRTLLLDAGAGADALGRATLGPIIKAVQDRQGGQRQFHLADDIVVTLTRNEIRILPTPD